MKHRMLTLLLVPLLLLSAAPACGPLLSFLPKVIAAVTDAALIVDMIEQHAQLALTQAGADEPTRRKVYDALARTKAALNAALRAAQAAETAGNLDQASIEMAFAKFKEAYAYLLQVVQPYGISEQGDTLSARAEVSGTTLKVPKPEALTLRLQ